MRYGYIAMTTRADEDADVRLVMEDIADARLVLTDELIAKSMRRGKAAERELRQNLLVRRPRARQESDPAKSNKPNPKPRRSRYRRTPRNTALPRKDCPAAIDPTEGD